MIVRAALTMILGRGETRERGEREAGRQAERGVVQGRVAAG